MHTDTRSSGTSEAGDGLEAAAHGEVLGHVGRAGLVARGLVWVVAGVLAALVALDSGSGSGSGSAGGAGGGAEQATTSGALRSLAGGTAGQGLLVLLAVGLAAYALWSGVRLVAGRREGSAWSRAAAGFQMLAYGALAVLAARLVVSASSGGGGGGSDQQAQSATARLLGEPAGQTVAVGLGLVVVAVGVGMVVYGARRKFLDHWREATTPSGARHAAEVLGVVGYTARGLVYGGSGAFVVAAAVTADPEKARGLDGTLAELAQQPFGPWLLGAVALGFVAYGALSIVEARYAKV